MFKLMAARLGIDIGGTFTDLSLLDESSGNIYATKVPSTPADPTSGIFTGLRELLDISNVSAADIATVVNSTSIPSLTVAERSGSKVALLTSEGFEHILLLGGVSEDFSSSNPHTATQAEPLADLTLTRGIPERMSAEGQILQPLDSSVASNMIQEIIHLGAEHIAISLLHSYANPIHERILRDLISNLAPGLPVTLSSELRRIFREFERTSLTVMNAYIQRSMITHLKILHDKFTDLSAPPDILVARSDGGLMGSERAQHSPIFAALSSSACAARAAHEIACSAAPGDALALDWGGSTTEIMLLHQTPRPPVRDGSVGPYRLGLPTLGTRHIGAGAGSLIDIPITGMIRIKAAAPNAPGPACYGLGGSVATLTDANVILGRLPLGLLGGRVPIDTGAAETAMSVVAKALGMNLVEAAKAVIDVANEKVYGNICRLASEKNLDAKHLTLIAFGGAGPLHANALGMLGNMFPVVIPPQPGMLSAHGALSASQRHELSQTILKPITTVTGTLLDQVLQKLQTHVSTQLQDDGLTKDKYTFLAEADLRYSGDSVEITLPLHLADPSANLDKLEEQFVSAHQNLSGFEKELPVEIVNLRIIGYTQSQVSTLKAKSQLRESESAIPDQWRICFDGDFLDTQVYERLDLTPDMSVSGPAVILQYDATTLIHPGHEATVGPDGTLLIQPQAIERV